MAMKMTYRKLVNEVTPSLTAISKIGFPMKVPIAHHLAIAENLIEAEKIAKIYWDTRDKVMKELCLKDKDNNPITIVIGGESSYDLSDENKIAWELKFEELNNEIIEVKLKKLDKKNFEGITDMKPTYLKGIIEFLK